MPLTNPSEVTVLLQTVVLSDAQIRALPTTPFTIVPAPGVGKKVVPITADITLDNQAGAYDATSSGERFWQLVYVTAPNPTETSGLFSVNALTVAGVWAGSIPALGTFNANEGYLQAALTGAENIENTALAIGDVYNGVDDYTGGNAANSLKVSVLYAIIDI